MQSNCDVTAAASSISSLMIKMIESKAAAMRRVYSEFPLGVLREKVHNVSHRIVQDAAQGPHPVLLLVNTHAVLPAASSAKQQQTHTSATDSSTALLVETRTCAVYQIDAGRLERLPGLTILQVCPSCHACTSLWSNVGSRHARCGVCIMSHDVVGLIVVGWLCGFSLCPQ